MIGAAVAAHAHGFAVLSEVPHHAPWIKSGLCAQVSAGAIGIPLGSTFVGERVGILRRSAALRLLVDRIHIVVDVVADLVANYAGQLVSIPQKRQQPSGQVDVAARHRKCVGRLLVQQYEMERCEVLPVCNRSNGVPDRGERPIKRRLRRDDLAALHVLHVALLADLDFPSLLLRGRGRPRCCRQEAKECRKGGERSHKGRHDD